MRLRTRLLVFFLGTTAALLVGFSAALYAMASTYLHRQAEERLEAILNTLMAAAEVNDRGVEWEPEERRLSFGRPAAEGHFSWIVCDDRGRRVDGSTPDAAPLFAPILVSGASGGRARNVVDPRGVSWRVLTRTMTAPRLPRPASAPRARYYDALILGAALSLTGVRETLARLALVLAALSCGTWTLALIVGGRLGRRALRPVASMAEAARAIGGDEPSRRLPEPRSRDELEDLGRAFNGLLDRLHEAHERQRRFTGDASHQLRTPLTAMQGQVDLALRQARTVEDYQRVLALVQRRTRHLRQIVEALLFLARADADAQRPDLVAIDLDSWMTEHVLALAEAPRGDDVRLEISANGPHRVRVQPALLAELVGNLLENAAKYGTPGTPIRLGLGRESGNVLVIVEDRGPGIAAGDLPHLFEPFYRTEDARRRGAAGLGLGLSVASRLARLFGGEIAVESRPGEGSTFTLRLPEAGGDRGTAPEASEPVGI